MNLGGGKVAPPTNKRFHVEFCTVATWKNGEIVEERLFYDLVGFLRNRPRPLTGRTAGFGARSGSVRTTRV